MNPSGTPDNLKEPWKPGQSGNPKGRPKSRVPEGIALIMGKKEAKKFYSLNNCEVDDWELAVLSMSASQLKTLAQWEHAAAYPKALSIAILNDMRNGVTKTVDKLRDRHFGGATQKIELSGKDGKPLTPEIISVEIIDRREQVDENTND